MPLQQTDLRGLLRLGVAGGIGITDLVEAVHHSIAARIGFDRASAEGRSSGLTGLVYGAVRGGLRGVGHGVDAALRLAERSAAPAAATPERDAFMAALNGLWGDHLADSGNPLAIPMALRSDGVALPMDRAALAARFPSPGRKLLVLVHGLCMSDRQWHAPRPRPWPDAGADAGLHTAVPALQQRPPCVAERPRLRRAAAAVAAGLAGAGGRAGDPGPQHGRAGGAQRLPPGRSCSSCPGSAH